LAFDVLPAFEIETPRNPQFGDYAANLGDAVSQAGAA
jgi:hypothetical protein